jgi:hypothetical protein
MQMVHNAVLGEAASVADEVDAGPFSSWDSPTLTPNATTPRWLTAINVIIV